MQYQCDNCDWNGTWDVLILEILCPLCRSSVHPVEAEENQYQAAAPGAVATVMTGTPS